MPKAEQFEHTAQEMVQRSVAALQFSQPPTAARIVQYLLDKQVQQQKALDKAMNGRPGG